VKNNFKIGKRIVGDGCPPLIIAELGINHNGSLDRAIEIADSAIRSGAEVIKHQTHIVEHEMTKAAKKTIPGNSKKSIYEIISKSSLNEEEEKKLMQHINKKKAIFISTPFSKQAADRLIKFNVPVFKIGSGECNNYPLIEYIAKFKKPIILSTGMNSIKTIWPAVRIFKKYKIKYALLHCTNIYPTPPELVGLNCINIIKKNFPDCIVGLSDHTTSNFTSLAAVALGAQIIERHFVDSKKSIGPDVTSSMDSKELKELILGSNIIYKSLERKNKILLKEEIPTKKFAFSSVVSLKDILPGEKLSEDNIWVKRPGTGEFLAKDFPKLIGREVKKIILKDSFIGRNSLKK